MAGIIKETGMVGIRTSILRRQNTVRQYIARRPILDLCKQATWRPDAQVSWRRWEQTGIDLKRAREKEVAVAAETETEADSESEDEPYGAARGGGQEESQGASGSGGAEWSGVERSGAEWSGVERSGAGRRMTEPRLSTGQDQLRVQT